MFFFTMYSCRTSSAIDSFFRYRHRKKFHESSRSNVSIETVVSATDYERVKVCASVVQVLSMGSTFSWLRFSRTHDSDESRSRLSLSFLFLLFVLDFDMCAYEKH